MRSPVLALSLLAASVVSTAAHAQTNAPDGALVFTRACANCHKPGQSEVPAPDALRALTPESIVNSLTNGKMAVQGSPLTAAERAAVAQFLTGRAAAASTTGAANANRCTASTPTTDPARAPSWMAWGNDVTNSRYAPQAGLTAADVPKLKLKWAFAYQGATSSRVQPALAGGKLFAASDNGELHALDPKTGCSYWTFKAESGVRSALTVGPYKANGRAGYAVFFGDQRAKRIVSSRSIGFNPDDLGRLIATTAAQVSQCVSEEYVYGRSTQLTGRSSSARRYAGILRCVYSAFGCLRRMRKKVRGFGVIRDSENSYQRSGRAVS
jgi:hypothetical protein